MMRTVGFVVVWAVAGASMAAPPVCTTHFFDWYELDGPAALEVKQKQWTYRIDWGWLGIAADEIGRSVHYYEAQCRKIREAGFDGIHYEWHGNPLKAQFRQALERTGLGVAMFYDMQIRFGARKGFLTPTEEFARRFVDDVVGFYRPIPRRLWLRDREGRLPIVVYGYNFDTGVTDPTAWDRFYRAIVSGVEEALGEQVIFHWTDTGLPQQLYAFQHFPEIASFTFNEAGRQTQVNARSVTFVVHYDDLGVSFARGGRRKRRWIRNDVRYLQESLWLALHTNPDLVFNYGWNELYEGEHLLPDALWGSWRYEVASAMIRRIKTDAKADLPRVLVIADDLLPAIDGASPEQAAVLRREMALLARLRALVPRADVVLPGTHAEWSDYDAVFSLNVRKDPSEEKRLAACDRPVVYANPDPWAATPLRRLFTATRGAQRVLPPAGSANEYVVASRRVDVDLGRYPLLEYRAKNSPGSLFHIRFTALDAGGKELPAWHETAPTDDCSTGGRWLAGREDVAQIARRATGRDVRRLAAIDVILDDLAENGRFTLDLDYLRLVSPDGHVGWEEQFESIRGWSVRASFQGRAGADRRFGFDALQEDGCSVGRLRLEAVLSERPVDGVDESTLAVEPLDDVRVLAAAETPRGRVPLLLARGRCYWLNTYTPSDACWEALLQELWDLPLSRGVMFRSFSHAVTADGLTSDRQQAVTIIQEEPLPVDRVRLVAPPELDKPLPHTLPAAARHQLRVLRGERSEIPCPDPGSDPPAVTLFPGEVVEVLTHR
ncbi:MAG TPA: hypothetical protein EYP56_16410 [Planctomycetaceae bacterium]|nr:hypothetical protein [Planctomycetaceae bacterium]HIQ20789.1 hypothetical protein [Planctomycetota bacterium]